MNRRFEPGHPENHWVDRGLVIQSAPGETDFNAIDPALLVDDKGLWLLFFGSSWSGLKAIELDPKTGKPAMESPEIIPVAKRALDVPHGPIEAPYVIRRNDWFYLFVSWDYCCKGPESDYKVVVGRSKSALGPYLDKSGTPMLDGGGTLVLESDGRWLAPGHNGVLQTGRGDFMVHHAFRRDLLNRTAEEYRNQPGALASLTDGLNRLRESAVQLARQDARDIVSRFVQQGTSRLAAVS